MQYWGTGKLGTHQSASYTGTAGTITNPIGANCLRVRVMTTTDAFVKVDVGTPTATTSDVYMPGFSVEYFSVSPGSKVSAVQVSGAGTLHVTEIN